MEEIRIEGHEDFEGVDSNEKLIENKPMLTTYTTCTPADLSILEIDTWDVKKLKQHIPVQQQKPSAAVQRMLDLRQQRHDLSNSNMWQDIFVINEITEKCFTKISDHFKKLLESFKIAITKMEKEILEQERVILYSKQDFTQAMEDAKKLFAYRRNIIDLYCQRVMEIEQIRSEKIKLVLRFYMKSFNKIAHHMPRDIQSFFEFQILSYNKTLMENVRCYGEIHLQLVLSGDCQFLKLKRKIDYLENQWDSHQMKQTRRWSEFSEYSRRRHSGAYAILNEDDSDDIRCHLKGDSWTQLLFQGLVCRWAEEPDIPHGTCSVNEWSSKLLGILMHLDLCAQKIIYLTKNALLNLLRGLELDFESVQYSSLAEDFYKSTTLHDVHLISAAIIAKIKAKTLFESEECMHESFDVQSLVLLMEQNNDITKDFLTSAAKLWDSHFRRVNICSRLVASGVNSVNEDRTKIDALEILFNTELDRLRQESDIEKLEIALKSVNNILDQIGEHHEEECEAEKEILKNYPQLLEMELAVFKAEVEQFSVNHPKVEVSVDLQDSQEQNLTVEADERKGDKVPHQIRMCIFQLEAIENWKLGLYECMEHFTSTCKDDFMEDAESWVSEMTKLSVDRLEIKRKFLTPRYERVRLEVHNVRLVELQQHRASLEAHQAALESYLSEISDEMDKFSTEQIKNTENFVAKLEEMISERDVDVLVSNTVSFMLRKTDVDIGKFISRINGFILDMQEDCTSKIKWLKESTINFLKSIKQVQHINSLISLFSTQSHAVVDLMKRLTRTATRMFSEGGNYSAAEVKVFLEQLGQVNKFLDTQGGLTKNKISSSGSALLGKVHDMLDSSRRKLKYLYEDIVLVEKTSTKINWLKKKMETEVLSMKNGHKILNKKVEEIQNTFLHSLYPLDTDKWNELLDELLQRNSYLLKSEGSKAKLTSVTLGQTTSTPSSSDYRHFFGWERPADGDTFLDCIRLNLWDVFGEIQELAEKFYSSKSEKNIIKKDVIPLNLRTFMEDLLEKCKFYLIQCEEAWIDQLREYLVLVTKMRETANSFVKLVIDGFRSNHVGELQDARSSFLRNFATKAQDQSNQLAEMDRSLMPLFGYPGNRNMLADLNTRAMASIENLVISTLGDFFLHRENLKEIHSTYEPCLNELLTAISEFCEKIFDQILSEKVALQLEEICEDAMTIIEMDIRNETRPLSAASTKTEGTASSVEEVSEIEIPSDTVIKKEIPKQYKLHIKYNPLLVKRICGSLKSILNRDVYVNKEVESEPIATVTSLEELSEKNSDVDSQVHVNSETSLKTPEIDYEMGIYFVKQSDVEEAVRTATSEYTSQYNDCFHKLTIDMVGFKTSSKEWLKKWKENVKEVQRLYTVPYDSEKPLDMI